MAGVSGVLFSATGKTSTKSSQTSLAAHLTRVAASHLEEDVSIEVAMTADGDFEVSLRVGKLRQARSLARGNARRIAADIRRMEAKGEQM